MKLVEIKIENFRGIRSLDLPLDDLTVLIGENNSGKSTVLEALRLALTRRLGARRAGQVGEYDFHLADGNATPHTAPPIRITLHFAESTPDEWPNPVIQQLEGVVLPDAMTGLYHVWLQIRGDFNLQTESFDTKWAFLNSSGNELAPKTSPLSLLQRFVPLFFLSALRDASQEFGQRGQFWSGFLKSIQLPDAERQRLEQMLREVNTAVIGANAGLTEVVEKIADARRLVPLNATDPVALEAIPTRVFDMVGKVQVHLTSCYGAKLPLWRHGEGTQSLAVLLLFQAFATANLAESYTPESSPILALEEPEAHLHPSAIRSLGELLADMDGQILVSSHSGDLVARVPILSIRRLYKDGGETKVGRVLPDQLSPRELQAINYSVCLTHGAYLFSRCWLLVEGETDFHLMPFLFDAMGQPQDQISLSVLEISQVVDKGEPFIKFAKALGIQWFMMADGDDAGKDCTRRAAKYLEEGEELEDRARNLVYLDIEHEFWHNGFDEFISDTIPPAQKATIMSEANGDDMKKAELMIKAAVKRAGGKPAFAQVLADGIQRRGKATIPDSIRAIIDRVVQLARD